MAEPDRNIQKVHIATENRIDYQFKFSAVIEVAADPIPNKTSQSLLATPFGTCEGACKVICKSNWLISQRGI